MVCELICSYVPSSCGRCGLRAGFGRRWRGSRGGARGTPSSESIARASTEKRSRVGGKRSSRKAHPGESRGAAGGAGAAAAGCISSRWLSGRLRGTRARDVRCGQIGQRRTRGRRGEHVPDGERRDRRSRLPGVGAPAAVPRQPVAEACNLALPLASRATWSNRLAFLGLSFLTCEPRLVTTRPTQVCVSAR